MYGNQLCFTDMQLNASKVNILNSRIMLNACTSAVSIIIFIAPYNTISFHSCSRLWLPSEHHKWTCWTESEYSPRLCSYLHLQWGSYTDWRCYSDLSEWDMEWCWANLPYVSPAYVYACDGHQGIRIAVVEHLLTTVDSFSFWLACLLTHSFSQSAYSTYGFIDASFSKHNCMHTHLT